MADKKKVFRTWLRIFAIPLLLILATATWVHSDYKGPFQNNFAGGFYRLSKLGPNPCNVNLNTCISYYSKLISAKSKQNVLVGDSEAESIRDLFDHAFRPNGITISRSGCPFIVLEINGLDKACRKLNLRRLKLLTSLNNSTFYVFNHNINLDAQETLREVQDLQSLTLNGNQVIYILPPAVIKGNFGAYALLLFKTPIGTPKFFWSNHFDSTYFKANTDIKMAIDNLKEPTFSYIDTDPLLCTHYPCELKDDQGEFLYQDSTHLSAFGGKILIDSILEARKSKWNSSS